MAKVPETKRRRANLRRKKKKEKKPQLQSILERAHFPNLKKKLLQINKKTTTQ